MTAIIAAINAGTNSFKNSKEFSPLIVSKEVKICYFVEVFSNIYDLPRCSTFQAPPKFSFDQSNRLFLLELIVSGEINLGFPEVFHYYLNIFLFLPFAGYLRLKNRF